MDRPTALSALNGRITMTLKDIAEKKSIAHLLA